MYQLKKSSVSRAKAERRNRIEQKVEFEGEIEVSTITIGYFKNTTVIENQHRAQ